MPPCDPLTIETLELGGPQHAKLVNGTSPDEGNAETLCLQREATSCFNHKVGACQAPSRPPNRRDDNDKRHAIQRRAAALRPANRVPRLVHKIKGCRVTRRLMASVSTSAAENEAAERRKPRRWENKKKKMACPDLVKCHHYILAGSHRSGRRLLMSAFRGCLRDAALTLMMRNGATLSSSSHNK